MHEFSTKVIALVIFCYSFGISSVLPAKKKMHHAKLKTPSTFYANAACEGSAVSLQPRKRKADESINRECVGNRKQKDNCAVEGISDGIVCQSEFFVDIFSNSFSHMSKLEAQA